MDGAFIIKVEKCPEDQIFVYEKQMCVEKSKAPECKNETTTTTEESELKRCEMVISNFKRKQPGLMRDNAVSHF